MYCILHNDICKVRPILRPRLTLAGHKPDGREIPQAQTNKSPTHTHPGIFFEKRRFFSFVLAFRPHVNGVFGRQKSRFSKASPEWSFWRRWLIVFAWANENRLFSTICYRISIVLAFSCGRAKTIWIRYVWTRIFTKPEEKISVVKNIRICLDRALFRPTCSTVFEALQVEATIKSKLTRWKVKTDKIFIFFFKEEIDGAQFLKIKLRFILCYVL